jgi:hypothetical protein
MRLEINWSVDVEFPKWVERIHDYVWVSDDDEEV